MIFEWIKLWIKEKHPLHHVMRKSVLCHVRTPKAQICQCTCVVWSARFNYLSFCVHKSKPLNSFWGCADLIARLRRQGFLWCGSRGTVREDTALLVARKRILFHALIANTTTNLTHIILASYFWDIGKQCRPRSERGVWSGSSLFANRNIYSK